MMLRPRAVGATLLFGCVSCVSVLACSSDDAAEEPREPSCEGVDASFRFPHGGDGHADPFGAKAAGQARAGRVRDASMIAQPPDAKHKVRPGDFVLANARIAVYVESENRPSGYAPFGGDILGIEPVGDDGKPRGVSEYGETLITLSRQTVKPEKVSVIADGSDGRAAIVRVSGVLTNIPFLDTFRALAQEEYDLPAALEYVLEPGAEKLVVRLSLVNTTLEAIDFNKKQFLGFFHTNRGQLFTEAHGFAPASGEVSWAAWDADRSSFLVRTLLAPMRAEIDAAGFQLFPTRGLSVDACATKTVDYVEIVPAAGGIDALLETKRRVFGEPPWREVRGVVKEAGGAIVPRALVHAQLTDGRYVTRARAGDDGGFVLHVPPGPAELVATAAGLPPSPPTSVPADAAAVDVVVPTRGAIDVTATDAQRKVPLPVRVQVLPGGGVARAPAVFGVRDEPDGRLWQEFAVTGRATLPVPPGTHRVIVSRGYAYEIHDVQVTAEAGKTTAVAASLARTADTAGVLCADFHIHSNYSADSSDDVEEKVKGAVVDGLDIPVSSEHEWIIDFQPTIERLGLRAWAFGLPSEELTTFTWGHFGVIPIFPRVDQPNNGAIDWVGKQPTEIFAQVNALPERPVIVVNHPRGAALLSYFSAAGLDRDTLRADPALWSEDFGALEIATGGDFESGRAGVVADWFSLLNAGKVKWGVGSSDSHDLRRSFVGYPRTCLRFGHDDPARLSADAVRDVLRAGNAVVNGGITMTVEGPGGVPPGGASQAGAYRVVVTSPSWLTPASVEVIVDGVTVSTLPLTTSTGTGPGKRFELTVDVQPQQSKARHWVVFHAQGEGDLAPVHPGKKPFAVSNPIFF